MVADRVELLVLLEVFYFRCDLTKNLPEWHKNEFTQWVRQREVEVTHYCNSYTFSFGCSPISFSKLKLQCSDQKSSTISPVLHLFFLSNIFLEQVLKSTGEHVEFQNWGGGDLAKVTAIGSTLSCFQRTTVPSLPCQVTPPAFLFPAHKHPPKLAHLPEAIQDRPWWGICCYSCLAATATINPAVKQSLQYC